MQGWLRLPLLLIAAVAACASPDAARGDIDTPGGPGAAPGIPLESVVGDCPVDSAARHDDPLALVEEFVRRDAEGPFEREDVARAWYAGALSCVERATSDHYEVIRGVRVAAGPQWGDSSVVYVTRDRLYYPKYDDAGRIIALEPAPEEWTDTVLVLRTTLGWRIHEISGGAHRLPAVARGELLHLEPAYTQSLDSLASRPGV